jgi:hypothetical protein
MLVALEPAAAARHAMGFSPRPMPGLDRMVFNCRQMASKENYKLKQPPEFESY